MIKECDTITNQNQSMVPSSRKKERKNEIKKREKERMKYHEYIINTSKRKQLSIPHNRSCLNSKCDCSETNGYHVGFFFNKISLYINFIKLFG